VQRGAPGQVVDVAITEGTALLSTGIRQMVLDGLWHGPRGENAMDGGCPWYTTYPTADGRHVAVAPLEPQFYAAFLQLLGLQRLSEQDRDDTSTWPALRAAFTERFASESLDYWDRLFSATDACVAPVLTFTEAARDEQLAARGAFVEHDGVLQPAPAPRFSATPSRIQGPPPVTGGDTCEALAAWGIDDVDDLVARGIAHEAKGAPA
jgi:alpha-methylacyl-CoA racemase